MSTAPKGYPSTQKLDRITADFASVTPVSADQNGLAVNASIYVYQVGLDAVDALSTNSKIIAAGIGGVAQRGDIIRFTSGALSGVEVQVDSKDANSVTLVQDLPAVPATLDAFAILRFVHPIATSGGGVSAALTYTLNGTATAVVEDTGTPANNRLLPVKIGNGTTFAGVTAANELKVKATTFAGRSKANAPTFYDYTVPVTTLAYTELVASTAAALTRMQIFDSSGEALVLATGAAGAETDLMMITPGGIDIDLAIPANSRISIKAVSGTASAGFNVINYLT